LLAFDLFNANSLAIAELMQADIVTHPIPQALHDRQGNFSDIQPIPGNRREIKNSRTETIKFVAASCWIKRRAIKTLSIRRVVLGGNLSLRLMSKRDCSGRCDSKEYSTSKAFSKTRAPEISAGCSILWNALLQNPSYPLAKTKSSIRRGRYGKTMVKVTGRFAAAGKKKLTKKMS
jgi:hypothetical protein